MMDWYGNGGWWGIGMLFMGVFWVAVIAAVIWAVVRLTGRPQDAPRPSPESPRQILDRRFASGEIDEQQYAQARRTLEGRGVDEPRR